MRRNLTLALRLAAAAAILVGMACSRPTKNDRHAEAACRTLVRTNLHAADGASMTDHVGHHGNTYTVTGSFGSAGSTAFTCRVVHRGRGWSLVSLTGRS